MIALFVLTRSQLRVDPVQPSLRAASQLSVGPDCDYRHFQDDPRPGGGIKEDHIRIEFTSVCRCETSFHHSSVGDSILNYQVRQRIADRMMWS